MRFEEVAKNNVIMAGTPVAQATWALPESTEITKLASLKTSSSSKRLVFPLRLIIPSKPCKIFPLKPFSSDVPV